MMYSPQKKDFILGRYFQAFTTGKIPYVTGLSRDEHVQRAVEAKLFTEDELRWLNETPTKNDSFVRSFEARITGNKPSVGFLQQSLAKVGGIESWNRMMFRGLTDVDIAGLVITGQKAIESEGIGIPIGFGYDDAKALANRVDVLVVSNEFGLVHLFKDAQRKPKVVFVHHGDVTCALSGRAVLTQAGCIDVLAGVHPATGNRFADVIPRTEYMPNAVDPRRCEPESVDMTRERVRKIVGIPEDAKVVLFSGRFTADKGYHLARAIGERLPNDIFMVMMGGDADGNFPQIRFVGKQRWPGTWYRAADIGISTSPEEGAGLSMMEMIYSRLPLVATRRGIVAAQPEIARVMADDATVTDWISAIIDELSNPDRVRRRVAIASSVVAHHYSFERFAKAWNRLLVEVAGASATVR